MEALYRKYQDRGVQVFVIDVKESKTKTHRWARSLGFTFPVLLDLNGAVSTRYSPDGIAPFLPRDQVPIGSNLIIDQEGTIRFFSLLDSVNFDAELIALTACLDHVLAKGQN